MCALLFNAGRLRRPFEWTVFRWIGLISFSLYMWHLPLLFVFMNIMIYQFHGIGHGVQLVALLAWVFFVIFPISLTFYRWIEMPGMRLGETLIQKNEKLKKREPPVIITCTPIQEAPSTAGEVEMQRSTL
jgi:peptidoglycan/LPS O-acetylase OafA/YrhL